MGHRHIICTDMGGTSFDVGLILDGRPLLRTTTTIDQHVMFLPSIDIVSIGAGGGSLVSAIDGRLNIGPESAGADPGPACYARGGEHPTLTDVDVVLGYIESGIDSSAAGCPSTRSARALRWPNMSPRLSA